MPVTETRTVRLTGASLDEFSAATYARLVAALTVTGGSRVRGEEVVKEAFVRLVAAIKEGVQLRGP